MRNTPRSLARVLISGVSLAVASMSPSLVSPARAEEGEPHSCCKTQGGNWGCEDTDANKCRAKGECHSKQQKECVVGLLDCTWMDNPNCNKEEM